MTDAIDRTVFFPAVRAVLFNGILHQAQVDGMNAILDEWEARKPGGDLRWLAYMLATVVRETAHTMQPVREAYWLSEEWRKANLRYYPFYGRGYVQLTWQANYQKMSALVGVDLVNNPDRAMEPKFAAEIMFVGMERGDFTGKKLGDYFSATAEDWVNARRIINGLDHADEIAEIGREFHAILLNASSPRKEAA